MALFECGSCRRTFQTPTFEPERVYSCPACRRPLTHVAPAGQGSGPAAPWPSEAQEAAEDPARRLGRFVLVRELGQGGMGTVHKAWDPPLRRWVAIKVLNPGAADPEGLERFRQEASVVASLDHPNIAPIYDVLEIDDQSAIVMKFIEGRTLEEMFREFPRGTSPIERVVRIIRDASLGLGYAHGRGFVHRDLKPGNLMVDAQDRVYVLDFGLAKVLARSGAMTDLGRIMGTPAYMSPEQAMGLARNADARSDVFSLGSTLWALLAGQRPFPGRTDLEVAKAILRDSSPSIRARRPDVPEGLDLVLRKSMQKERDARYPTAAELASALNECLIHEEASRETARRAEPIHAQAARPVVLVIEDEPQVVALIQKALEQERIDVVHFSDGTAAMQGAVDLQPAVVLLDVNLPGLNGWEILHSLRRIPSYEKVPIIMVTGENADESVARGFQMGAADYITKPFSPLVFRARVRRQLLLRGAADGAAAL